jgi:hypothetical protein
MTTFQEDYERRIRALLGAPAGADVFVSTDIERGWSSTGCDTCGHGADPDTLKIDVRAEWREEGARFATYRSEEYTDLGEFIRALDSVGDE